MSGIRNDITTSNTLNDYFRYKSDVLYALDDSYY